MVAKNRSIHYLNSWVKKSTDKPETKMIKKIIISILVIATYSIAFAQKDSAKIKMKVFIVSAEFYPQACYRNIDAPNNTTKVQKLSSDIFPYLRTETYNPKNDKTGLGFGGGLFGSVKVYKGLRIKTGVSYETFKYHTGLIDTFVTKYDSYQGTTIDKSVNNTRIDYEFHFISFFLSANYYFKLSKKLFLNTGIGYMPTVYKYIGIAKTGHDPEVGRLEYTQYNYQSFRNYKDNQFVRFSIGLNYYLTKKMSISAEPFFKYGLNNKILKFGSTATKMNFYSYGCNLGFNF